ncbi:unnamed protein product [Staurois parvus]|uniref:Uncharacterized protein n=1 Tax=Staurois parvus TaxID=386267 RepID=A0ABN9GTH8_9NEOB|nr:unnamed protein product [Staurois parvus]
MEMTGLDLAWLMWGCSKICQGGRRWAVSRAVYKGSAGQRIGSSLSRAVYRGPFVGAEDRGHCWQGRGQE